MPIAHSPLAPVNSFRPEPPGICDRCARKWLLRDLLWQFDWRGNQLVNLRIRVCRDCYDLANDQLRPIIIGPDPFPVDDPRPGFYAQQMAEIGLRFFTPGAGPIFPPPLPPPPPPPPISHIFTLDDLAAGVLDAGNTLAAGSQFILDDPDSGLLDSGNVVG